MTSIEQMMQSLDFGTTLAESQKGLLVKPLLRNFLYDGNKPHVSVEFKPHPLDLVAGDGWFHPSTHPLLDQKQLYDYLVCPEDLAEPRVEYMGTLSMMIGTALHGFLQACMVEIGLLQPKYQRCEVCPAKAKCREPGVMDERTGARGHMDGRLTLPTYEPGSVILELKTTGEGGERKMLQLADDLDNEAFKAKFLPYWAQAQEYMRISGYRLVVLFMMGLGYPWPMREFHIHYDPHFAGEIQEKYLQVRQAVADQQPPHCHCTSIEKSKCLSRNLCP